MLHADVPSRRLLLGAQRRLQVRRTWGVPKYSLVEVDLASQDQLQHGGHTLLSCALHLLGQLGVIKTCASQTSEQPNVLTGSGTLVNTVRHHHVVPLKVTFEVD